MPSKGMNPVNITSVKFRVNKDGMTAAAKKSARPSSAGSAALRKANPEIGKKKAIVKKAAPKKTAVKKPASMAKGSLAKKVDAKKVVAASLLPMTRGSSVKKAAPKKAAAAKKPGMSKSRPRRASY